MATKAVGRGRHFVAAPAHAAAAVNDQPDRRRKVVAGEELDRPRFTVVEHGEMFDAKSGDERAVPIDDGDGQRHQIGSDRQYRGIDMLLR